MWIERPKVVYNVVDNETGLKDLAISSGILRHTKLNIIMYINQDM